MPDTYILVGHEPVAEPDPHKFSEWFGKADRCVRYTKIKEGVEVSTVFLGFDHGFGDHGSPVLFETMIFGGDQDQEYQTRACTWDEALDRHRDAILVACANENVLITDIEHLPSPKQQAIEKAKAEQPPASTWYERLMKDDD